MPSTVNTLLLSLKEIELSVLSDLKNNMPDEDQKAIMEMIENFANSDVDIGEMKKMIAQTVSTHGKKQAILSTLEIYEKKFLPIKENISALLPPTNVTSTLSELEKDLEKLDQTVPNKAREVSLAPRKKTLKYIMKIHFNSLHLIYNYDINDKIKTLNNAINYYNTSLNKFNHHEIIENKDFETARFFSDKKTILQVISEVTAYLTKLEDQKNIFVNRKNQYDDLRKKFPLLRDTKEEYQKEKEEMIIENKKIMDTAIRETVLSLFSSEKQLVDKIKASLKPIQRIRPPKMSEYIECIRAISPNTSESAIESFYNQLRELISEHNRTLDRVNNTLTVYEKAVREHDTKLNPLLEDFAESERNMILQATKAYNPSFIYSINEIEILPVSNDIEKSIANTLKNINTFSQKASSYLNDYQNKLKKIEADEMAKLYKALNEAMNKLVNKGNLNFKLQKKCKNEIQKKLMQENIETVNEHAKRIYMTTYEKYEIDKVKSDIYDACCAYQAHLIKQNDYENAKKTSTSVNLDYVDKVELAHKIRVNDNLLKQIESLTDPSSIRNFKNELKKGNTEKILTANRDDAGFLLFQTILHAVTFGLMFFIDLKRKGSIKFWQPHSAAMKDKIHNSINHYETQLERRRQKTPCV